VPRHNFIVGHNLITNINVCKHSLDPRGISSWKSFGSLTHLLHSYVVELIVANRLKAVHKDKCVLGHRFIVANRLKAVHKDKCVLGHRFIVANRLKDVHKDKCVLGHRFIVANRLKDVHKDKCVLGHTFIVQLNRNCEINTHI